MTLGGLQKLTLLDFPGKVACTVFTKGCNFRCPFCHNASLVVHNNSEDVSEEDLLSFLEKRKKVLDGICITGGEPLLHEEIFDLIERIHAMGYLVKLDTNGSFPKRLSELVGAGMVDYVAMDVKNCPEKYAITTGCTEEVQEAVKESASFLMKSSIPFEFRTTVVRGLHEEKDFVSIGKWIAGVENYFLQAFVDSGDLIDRKCVGCSVTEMQRFLEVVREFVPSAQLRGI